MAKEPTALELYKKLQEDQKKLIGPAKEEALANAQEAVKVLNELGFNYELVEGVKSSKAGKTKTKEQEKGAPCPICDFETSPPHDGRKHRSQGGKKKPFTPEELKQLGLRKVTKGQDSDQYVSEKE